MASAARGVLRHGEAHLLREERREERQHARRRFEQGLAALRSFLEREVEGREPPTEVERVFRIKLEDVVVQGRMDRVDEGAIARWLDERIVSFVKTYVALEGDDFFVDNLTPE